VESGRKEMVMVTRSEALLEIQRARDVMESAVRAADRAIRASTESGLLTAAQLVQEGLQVASEDAFGQLPRVEGYIGTTSTQADVQRIEGLRESVVEAATTVGRTVALLTKLAAMACLSG